MGGLKIYLVNFFISFLGSFIGSYIIEKVEKGRLLFRSLIVFFVIIFVSGAAVIYIIKGSDNKNDLLAQYRADFLSLRTDFENLCCYSPDSLPPNSTDFLIYQELSKDIPDLTGKIARIYDNELDEGYVILKYDLLCYLTAMYTELIDDSLKKIANIEQGLHYYDLAMKNVHLIESKQRDDDYYRSVLDWLDSDDARDRLKVLRAWLLAAQYRIDGISTFECRQIKNLLDEIDPAYKRRNPLRKNPSLKYFLNCQDH